MKCVLQNEIELIRKAMVDVALEKGLASEETLRLSRELDVLINEFEAITFKHNPDN